MILILSDELDHSTNKVINWIIYFNKRFLRINPADKIHIHNVWISDNQLDVELSVKNHRFLLSEIDCYWYRRGVLQAENLQFVSPIVDLPEDVKRHLTNEVNTIIQYIHFVLLNKTNIGSYLTSFPNKLINLQLARKQGLIIPSTLITTEKEFARKFLDEVPLITKAISETISYIDETGEYKCYTSQIQSDILNDYTDVFFPSLFQENIIKQFELRIFFLDGSFYSMAIISQSHPDTQIDFRKYPIDRPNRTVPYNLPEEIKLKLSKLFDDLNLRTGSVDMIVTHNNEHVFLEINPIGQYDMTSYPCNYQLDYKIAKYLCTLT